MYRVAISNSVYHKFQSFDEWNNDMSFDGDYEKYLIEHQKPELKYINFISTDDFLDNIPESLYDKRHGALEKLGGYLARFRIFHFKSEAHYIWFMLKWS